MTDVNTKKTVVIEFTPDQYERLLQLQPDESKLPQVAQDLLSQALRESMNSMPGRKTKPMQVGSHESE